MAKRPSTKKKTVPAKKKAGKKKAAKAKAVKKAAVKRKAAKKPAKKPAARTTAAIPADSPDYPPYIITFEGSLISDPPQTVRGTHTVDGLLGNSRFSIAITHNDTDPGIPNLTARVEPEE
jgi:hypothetical protein